MELHCNLSRLEQEAQTRLASSDTLTPEETAYYGALVDYAMECRPLLNHGEPLPEMPKLTDFDQSLQDYKKTDRGRAGTGGRRFRADGGGICCL